ncbi:hypothetical protein IE53DRAFT_367219 [Violaceomyces palustris]|uniref:Uncharacterized protein n=1 Tax=Violaceomyces palustris TaxID=1673888 RepID=A0ACD0P328_9BASI|nr:hypothetical protein IE53DRAFT_367219 [Violaceomyces palustris]
MEFFFPTDVFAYEHQHQQQPPLFHNHQRQRSVHPRTSCASDAPLSLFDLIHQQELVAQAQAQAQARAQAIQRERAIRAAQVAQRRVEEQKREEQRQIRAYFQHLLEAQQREEEMLRRRQAQRQYQIQLEQRRQQQQMEEYQRRKALAIEQERRRIAALQQQQEERRREEEQRVRRAAAAAAVAKQVEDQSRLLFLALEDILFGGSHQNDDDNQPESSSKAFKSVPAPTESTVQSNIDPVSSNLPTSSPTSSPSPSSVSQRQDKGKAREVDVTEEENKPTEDAAMDVEPAQNMEAKSAATTTTATVEAATPSPKPGPSGLEVPMKEDVLVFTHQFNQNSTDHGGSSDSIKADSIKVTVDEDLNKVTVSGLWPTAEDLADSANTKTQEPIQRPSSPALSVSSRASASSSSSSSSSSKRGRSPRRARVSDVDENGDEIMPDDDEEEQSDKDDFVKVEFSHPPSSSSPSSPADTPKGNVVVERTFDLPKGARAEDLRAELTDQGLKLWASVEGRQPNSETIVKA